MTDRHRIERRTFVQAITAASGAALSMALLPQPLPLNLPTRPPGRFRHFETAEVKTDDNKSSSGVTATDPRCSWFMGFPEPA